MMGIGTRLKELARRVLSSREFEAAPLEEPSEAPREVFSSQDAVTEPVSESDYLRLKTRYAILMKQREDLINDRKRLKGLSVKDFHHLRSRHDILVKQRDDLLNERDRLMKALQEAGASRALKIPNSSPASRISFPADALPRGKLPSIHVIDIGAQKLEGEGHAYQALVDCGIARIVGFEPLAHAAESRVAAEPSVKILSHFIGSGSESVFYINRDDATSSLLPANSSFLNRFESLAEMCTPVAERTVTTTRLDDVEGIEDCDYLKIDVQGGELDALKGASGILSQTVAIHCEVEFSEVYSNQPLFGDVDSFLRASGFELIDILNAGYATVRSLPRPIARSRLLWGEAVYMRTPDTIKALGPDKIARAAVIAHVNYGAYDVAGEYMSLLARVTGTDSGFLKYGASVTQMQ